MKDLGAIMKWLTVSVIFASVPFIGGCGGNTVSWQEEVKLLDGRVITVAQKRRYEGRVPREHWLTFKLPDFGNREITWHESLLAQVLNVYEGKLYIVGRPFTEKEYLKYGKPFPVYVTYRYEDGQWQRIPFSEVPRAIYDTNLLIANEPPNGAKFVSRVIKTGEMNDDTLGEHYKKLSPTYDIAH